MVQVLGTPVQVSLLCLLFLLNCVKRASENRVWQFLSLEDRLKRLQGEVARKRALFQAGKSDQRFLWCFLPGIEEVIKLLIVIFLVDNVFYIHVGVI